MNRDKLIRFPEFMLSVLEDFKKLTGESVSSYIRVATARQMIEDKLIKLPIKSEKQE